MLLYNNCVTTIAKQNCPHRSMVTVKEGKAVTVLDIRCTGLDNPRV